jgi:hypothetical protein
MVRILLVVFLLVLIVAPAPSVDARTMATDKWAEYSSDNFSVVSDGKPKDVRQLLTDLEHFRFVVLNLIGIVPRTDEFPFKIIAFRREKDYQKTIVSKTTAGYFTTTLRGHFAVVDLSSRMTGNTKRRDVAARPILFHEYVHYLLSNSSSVRYPKWYEEGLAEYLSTYSYDGVEVKVGQPNNARIYSMSYAKWLSGKTLLEADPRKVDRHGNEFYAQSWLLVHLLHSQDYSANLKPYLTRWSQGETALTVFEESFGLEVSAVKDVLYKYWRRGRYTGAKLVFSKPLPTPPIAETRLSEADIAVELGLFLQDRGVRYAAASSQLFEQALAISPGRTDAQVGLAMLALEEHEFSEADEILSGITPAETDYALYYTAQGDRHLAVAVQHYRSNKSEWRKYRSLAQQSYKRALRADKQALAAWIGLGITCFGQEEFREQGRIALDEVHYVLPTHQEGIWLSALHALEVGDNERAKALSEELLVWASGGKMSFNAGVLDKLVNASGANAPRPSVEIVWSYLDRAQGRKRAGKED